MAKNDMMEDALAPRKSAWAAARNGEGFEQFPAPGDPGFYSPVREELGFREFWRSLQRHKLIVLVAVILITAIGTMLNLRAKSTYLASTVMVIGNQGATILKADEVLLQNEDSMGASATAIKTKMVMMKSHELLEDVIVELQFDRDPRFLAGLEQGLLRRVLLFDPNAPPAGLVPTASGDSSTKEATRAAEERIRLDPLVMALEDNLSIEQIKETRALKLSFVHTDPQIAAAVTDKVAQSFIQRNFQSNTESFTNVASWLNQSTMELKRRVQQAEQSLADYTRNNNIFTTEGSSTLTTEKLAKLHDQVTRAESDRVIKEALYEEVKSGRVAEVPEVFAELTSKSSSAPRLIDLDKQLGALSTNEAQLSVNFGPSNPQLQEVRQQIAAVKDQIVAGRKSLNNKLQAEYEHAVREEQGLKAALAQAKAEAVNENQAAIQFNILKQEVETAKALYTEFLQKSNQSKVRAAEQYSNIHIVDHAKVPTIPYGPRRGLNILLWFTISVLIGVGLALLLEFMDHTIKDGDDIAQYLLLPTLAVIPRLKTGGHQLALKAQREEPDHDPSQTALSGGKGVIPLNGEVVAKQQDRLVAMEAYHALRTSVIFSSAEWTPKTILVTSSKPGDGKTTTTINLAFSLCELDARVLLIDANLRHPTANQVLGLDRNLGLSTYLAKNAPAEQLIQHFTKPRLSFLAAGPIPPNPATLISSPKMQSLLEMLKHEYDYILIDSPPFGSVSDTAILSTMVDGVVFVVQGGKSRRDVVARARNDLLSLGARILGVVLNNVHQKSEGYRDYADTRYYSKQAEQ
ncbi:MAG TPA: polysaccharide biosynthesis tyrosine autokinase [Blastocatellia bacterium]|nr:polysaccharide biosynthesis tyrosine autokinase [Blastocatellia bacterium]